MIRDLENLCLILVIAQKTMNLGGVDDIKN
jgi:hypothetical protein